MNNPFNRLPTKTVFEDLPETTQYITFDLGGYRFAIPSDEILKIVATPPSSQGGLVGLGLVQLGPYSIQVIDLFSLLSLNSANNKDNPRPSASSSRALEQRKKLEDNQHNDALPFLVVLQGKTSDLWGVALSEPPDLIEVPNYALKPVPAQRRLTPSLRWVSHIVSYDLDKDRHSLLVLDLSSVMTPQADQHLLKKMPRMLEA